MTTMLPPDQENQTYVTVHALNTGGLWMANNLMFQDSIHELPDVGHVAPCLSFLISHRSHGLVLFDLGMRKVSPNV